jgi:hypothetical protein
MLTRLRPIFVVLRAAALPFTFMSSAPARADATAECIAADDAAVQLRTGHKLREARGQFLRCAEAICPAELREECGRRVAEVNVAIPTIVFVVKDAAGVEMSAVKIRMDGQPWVDRLDGTAIAVDPGEHSFTFEVEGGARTEKRLVVHEGERDRRETVVVGPRVAPGPPRPSTPLAEPATQAPARDTPTNIGMAVGLTLGGAGVAGIAVGTVFGLLASSKWSQAKSDCAQGCLAGSQARAEQDVASTEGTASTIAFVAGGAALAASLVLFLLAPTEHPAETASRWTLRMAGGVDGGKVTLERAW